MEMFNVHRRDLLGFEDYMDLKKPGFGGPLSAIPSRDAKGKLLNKKPKLSQYRRVVERDPAFSHKVWDPTYKAMTHDLVYRQEGKKPFTYPDPYLTAYPTVEIGEVDENTKVVSFNRFVNEDLDPRDEDYGKEVEYQDTGYDFKDYDLDSEEDGGYAKGESSFKDEKTAYRQTGGRSTTSPEIKRLEDKLRSYETSRRRDEWDEYGLNPEEENNPLGLSKEEMDKFLNDLKS